MLASSGPPGGRLGGLLGASWPVLGHLGGFFGGFGGILDPLGPSWRPSWTLLGHPGGYLGPSWANVEAILAILEAIVGHLGAIWNEKTWQPPLPGGRRAGQKPQGEPLHKNNQNQTVRNSARQAPL